MEGSHHLEPQEGFSFGRPGEPHLEPNEGFPLLLLSPVWSPMEGSPHLEPDEGFSFGRLCEPNLEPLLLSLIWNHMGGISQAGSQ